MTMEKSPAMKKNDVFSKLGKHNCRIVDHVQSLHASGGDLEAVAVVLDSYYEVANPLIYSALQSFADVRLKNAESVLAEGKIHLLHTEESVPQVDMDRVLERVCSITRTGGA